MKTIVTYRCDCCLQEVIAEKGTKNRITTIVTGGGEPMRYVVKDLCITCRDEKWAEINAMMRRHKVAGTKQDEK